MDENNNKLNDSQNDHINHLLTDDCLRLILDEFPLRQQLALRRVCHRWLHVIDATCQLKCSLKIFCSYGTIQQYISGINNFKVGDNMCRLKEFASLHDTSSDVLILKDDAGLIRSACENIPILFPNITVLIVYCHPLVSCSDFWRMLQCWAPNLSSLILFRLPREVSPNVWFVISTMKSLKRFHLVRMYLTQIPEKNLSIMSGLKHFCITHYMNDLVPVLSQLGPCQSIKLAMCSLSVSQLEKVFQMNPRLVAHVQNLSLGIISSPSNVNRLENYKNLLNLICTRFERLEFLDILMADQLQIVDAIPFLSQLRNLTELWLAFVPHQLNQTSSSKVYNIPPLRSIRTLYLEIDSLSSNEFFHWAPKLFPNVQNLTLRSDVQDFENERQLFGERLNREFKFLQRWQFK